MQYVLVEANLGVNKVKLTIIVEQMKNRFPSLNDQHLFEIHDYFV